MSKGRRKMGPVREVPVPQALPAPVADAAEVAPRRRRGGIAAIVILIIVGGAFAMKALGSKAFEPREPPGLEQAVPEVREHVRARVASAREDTKSVARLTDLGLALAANGFWRDARPAFEAVAGLSSDDPLPAYYVARAHLETGDSAAAREQLEKVLRKFPKFAQAQYALGSVLLDEGRVDEAAARFNDLVSSEGPDAGWGRIGLAKTLLLRGRADQAVTQLEPVVRLQPSFGEAQYLIGTAYRSLKRPDLASRHLALGVRESAVPMPDAWSNRLQTEARTIGGRISHAQALRDAGRLADAISVLEPARTGHPDDLELLSNLGAMYLDAGQPERAREILLRAEKVNAGHVPTVYNLVAAELRLKDFDGALAHSGKALELAPTQAHSYLARSDVFTAMERYAEAVTALREAIRLDPRDANLRFRTGMLLGRLEKFQEAKAELDVATQIEPSHFEAWVLLCEACIRLKLGHEAQVALEQASRLRPDTKELDGLRQRVRALGGG